MDGYHHYATMHIVTNDEPQKIKSKVREELRAHGIGHVTLEIEREGEHCHEESCLVDVTVSSDHHHHHH
jgi:hypothetical protein